MRASGVTLVVVVCLRWMAASDLSVTFSLAVILLCIDGVALSDEKRLIKHLLQNYDTVGLVGRPVFNTSDTISVQYGLALIQILDLDEKNQVLTTNCWNRYIWHDILLRWNPDDFGGVQLVRVPTDQIWTPDIVLYNYADDRLKEHRKAFAVVDSNGTVLWIPQAIFKSSCVIDITHFPFDKQECKLKFGSWTYDGFKLDINFYSALEEVDLNDYIQSNEWTVIAHPAYKNTKYYPCCNEPFPDLTFHLVLRRKVAFYNYILILPCVLLSSLTLVLFWLPPESPAKMVLGMNIFVAFFVLLLLLAESTPPAASSIPLIGAYYCLNMILITLSTFLSVIVINLYFRGDKRTKVPKWLKTVFIDVLARVLCMRSELMTDPTKKIRHSGDFTETAGREGKAKRRIKATQDKIHNKFQMQDMRDQSPNPLLGQCNGPPNYDLHGSATGSDYATHFDNTPQGGSDNPQTNAQASIEHDVKEIRRYLRQLLYRVHQREAKNRVAHEWKVVALVLDRIFFFMYLAAIIISLATIFPKTY